MGRLGQGTAMLVALGAAIFAAAGSVPVQAQAPAATGGAFGAGNGPIDISADELEVVDSQNRAVWKGNVEAIQGENRMRSPTLTIFYAARGGTAGGTDIQKMEADGPVYYVTPVRNARGDHATYEAATNTMIMTGNVVLVQDKNVVQGDRLTIDTKTNHATLVSNAQARTTNKRVRGVFYPSQSSGAAAPAARP